MDLSGYHEDDIEKLLHEQATILFKRCDYGNKNYVTRDDLLTLASELDLSTDQVTEAFDKLNVNNRDFLTLREFINGFGVFLGIDQDQDINGGVNDDLLRPGLHSDDAIMENEELEKAIELFNACDVNNHGYVSLYDLKHLTSMLELTENQISDIFQLLDEDGNGFITLNEFVNGFSHFVVNLTTSGENNNDADLINKPSLTKKEPTIDEIYFMDSTQQTTAIPLSTASQQQHQGMTSSLSHTHTRGMTTSQYITDYHDKGYLERSDSHSSRASERSFITRQMSIRYETGATEVDDMLDSLETEFGR